MSFYDDASLVFLAGGAAGKDGKAYSVKPDGSLGSELIINGTFDSDSDWSKGTGWSISGGVASCDGSQSTTTSLHNTAGNGLVNGKTYRVEYTITSYSAGSVRVKAGNTGFGVYRSAAGTYVEHLVAEVYTFPTIQFNADSSFVGSIDNVSCKEVDVADFTFTRGSNLSATRVGKDGYIEKGRENLLLQSNNFGDSTTWVLNSASVTSGEKGYDGTNDAWLLDSTSTYSVKIYQDYEKAGVSTFSIYAKQGTLSQFALDIFTSTGVNRQDFNLSTGSLGASGSVISADITDAGGGWYRCSVTTNNTGTVYYARILIGLGTIYIQDAQLELGLAATDYIETGATTATAGVLEDEPRFDYSGGGCPALLMEPQRANLVNQSEYFGDYLTSSATVTQNALLSPEGLQNASTVDITSNAGSVYAQSGSVVESVEAETNYTFSFYVKQGTNTENYLAVRDQNAEVFIDADVAYTASSSEWTRVEHTFTTPVGCTSIRLYPQRYSSGGQGTTHIWGMQLEEGSYPTSYIPTYGATATRSKEGASDSYDQTAVLDLSSIGLDGEDVSWFFELKNNQDVIRDNGGTTIRVSSNTSNLGSFRIYRSDASNPRNLTVVFQDTGSNFTPSGYEMTSENPKVVVKRTWSTGRIQVYVDGASVIDQIDLDHNAWYKLDLSGGGSTLELKQLLAFPMVLSNNDCEILTGTSYTSFASMASTLSYTQYE